MQGFSNIVAVKEIKKELKNEKNPNKIKSKWASEAKALAKMNTLSQDHIVRFITAFRRRLNGYEEHYLVFEWADGGNLRDLWESIPKPNLEPGLIQAAVIQLSGLAEALRAAHYLKEAGTSYRHGDLKPANILWFHDGTALGKLKIGDWGCAKAHNMSTEFRPSNTTAEYGTRRYEAPEVVTGIDPHFLGQAVKRRSRLYDIWAMGCITLEFIVWLLYGIKELNKFNRSIQGRPGVHPAFYQILSRNNKDVAEVHDKVIYWMTFMTKDPACRDDDGDRTAIGDLLDVVRTRLLVVKLPSTSTVRNEHNSVPSTTPNGSKSSGDPLPQGDTLPGSPQPRGLVVTQPVLEKAFVQEPLDISVADVQNPQSNSFKSGDALPIIAVSLVEDSKHTPPPTASPEPPQLSKGSTRANAIAFCKELQNIAARDDIKYWTVRQQPSSFSDDEENSCALKSEESTADNSSDHKGTLLSVVGLPERAQVR